jgi:hypothetical protein
MQQALRNRLSKPIDDDRGDNPRGIEEKLIVTPGERVVAGVNYFFRRRQLFLPVLSLHHWSTIAQSDAKSVRSSGSEISARFRS